MNDESYYKCLDILDRINDEAISKFGSGYAFSKALGRDKSFWNSHYGNVIFPRLKNIVIYSKLLDVSVEYLLTGKNKQKYKDCEIDYNKIYNEYKKHKIPVDKCYKLAPIMFKVKRGSSVNLGTLIELSDMFNISAYDLVFKKPLGE